MIKFIAENPDQVLYMTCTDLHRTVSHYGVAPRGSSGVSSP